MADTVELETKLSVIADNTGKASKQLDDVSLSLEGIWDSADKANKEIAKLLTSIGKLNNTTLNINGSKNTQVLKTSSGAVFSRDAYDKTSQAVADKIQDEILKEQKERLEHEKELTKVTKEKAEKAKKDNANYDRLLDIRETEALTKMQAEDNKAAIMPQNKALLRSKTQLNTQRSLYLELKNQHEAEYRKIQQENAEAHLLHEQNLNAQINETKELKKERADYYRAQTEKTKLYNKNFNQILDNQTSHEKAYAQKQTNEANLVASRNAYNNARASYYTGKGQGTEWYDTQLSLMKSRDKLNQMKIANSEHFAHGGKKRSFRYQFGMGFIDAGSYLGKNLTPPIANVVSTATQLIGTSLSNPAAGVAVGITQLTKAITQLGQESIKAYSEIESIKTQLGVVHGNQTQANQMFGELSAYAIKSPFGVSQTAELATLLKQSGVEASNLMDTLKMLGDTAGGNMEKMKRIANNYAQIVSIGKASMLDMRQFAYAGIPIFEKVAEELDVSQTALRKMISDGKVTSEVITKVFKDMTSEGGLFFEATSKGAETLKARLQNLKDSKQLALGSIGESLLRIGEYTGSDSIAYKGVSLAEDFYTKINEISTLKNLEKSVGSIERNKREQERLERILQYAKDTGSSQEVIKVFEEQLKELKAQFDPDKQRSINADLYEIYGGTNYTPAKSRSAIIEEISSLNIKNEQLPNTIAYKKEELGFLYETEQISYEKYKEEIVRLDDEKNKILEINKIKIEALNQELELIKKQKKITEDIRKGWLETQVINSQQTAFDIVSANSKMSGSSALKQGGALTDLSTLQGYYDKTEKMQAKEKENLASNLEKSRQLLLEIAGNSKTIMNKDGSKVSIVDFEKVSGAQLKGYIAAGAVTARKLAATADSKEAMNDWLIIKDQLIDNYNDYYASMKGLENVPEDKRNSVIPKGSLNESKIFAEEILRVFSKESMGKAGATKNIDSFYNYLTQNYEPTRTKLMAKRNSATGDTVQFWQDRIDELDNTLLQAVSETEIPPETAQALLGDAKKKQFIPLWKRIIQSFTGIDHTAIKNVTDSIDFYSENLSTRSMTGSTLSALAKEGLSVDMIKSLTSARNTAVKLPNDERGKISQIDWEQTRKKMTEFATGLRTSTTAIDTWTSGLEKEYDTYAELLGSGILSAESNGVGKAMYISTKKLAEGWSSEGEKGVNAFGTLYNEDGKLVKEIKDGIAYGEDEKALANQNLKVTDEIYTVLKKHLENIDTELKEARKASAKNTVLSGMQDNVLGTYILNVGLKGSSYGLNNFAMQNPEQYTKWVNQNLDTTGYESTSDLYSKYLTGDKDAVKRVNDALEKTNTEVLEFINTDLYTNLEKFNDNLPHTEEINTAYNTVVGYMAPSNPSDTDPFNAKGMDGVRYKAFERGVLNNLGITGVTMGEIIKQSNSDRQSKVNELEGLREKEKDGSINNTEKERIKLLEKEIALTEDLTEAKLRGLVADKEKTTALDEFKKNSLDSLKASSDKALVEPFKLAGEYILKTANGTKQWTSFLDDGLEGMKAIAGEMASNIGNEMITCGLRIASAGALKGEAGYSQVAAGLALAAAGGLAAGLGSALTSTSSSSNDTESDKLQSLADQIKALLAQARSDALYYENNMRHREALGRNKEVSYRSVNDAIIAPNGNVITTAPDDYLIATKQPQNLVSGGSSSPVVNFTVQNYAGVNVKKEQRQNPDGSLEIVAIIESVVDGYIASEKSDGAFNTRNRRLQGTSYVM